MIKSMHVYKCSGFEPVYATCAENAALRFAQAKAHEIYGADARVEHISLEEFSPDGHRTIQGQCVQTRRMPSRLVMPHARRARCGIPSLREIFCMGILAAAKRHQHSLEARPSMTCRATLEPQFARAAHDVKRRRATRHFGGCAGRALTALAR